MVPIARLASVYDTVWGLDNLHASAPATNADSRPVLLVSDPAESITALRDAVTALQASGRHILIVAPLASESDGVLPSVSDAGGIVRETVQDDFAAARAAPTDGQAVKATSDTSATQDTSTTAPTSRAVCSGHLALAANSILVENGITYLGEDPLAAPTFRVLENGLTAVQTAVTAEGCMLSTAIGVPDELYLRAIGVAAGASWSLRKLGPRILDPWLDEPVGLTHGQATKALSETLDLALQNKVYAPLSSLAQNLYALPDVSPDESAARVSDLWLPGGANIASNIEERTQLVGELCAATAPKRVGVVGLGAMGYGMAHVLRRAGLDVVGYDVYPPSRDRYASSGGTVAATPAECATGADVLVMMVMSAEQAHTVLFDDGAAAALLPNATVLLMITASSEAVESLSARLTAFRPDLHLVDAPVSGGSTRAADGDLTCLIAGLDTIGAAAGPAITVLQALSGSLGNLAANFVLVPGGPGRGAAVKSLNQHLGGTHITACAEYLSLAASLGLPLRLTREILLQGPAWTFILFHRGKNMLDGLLRPPTAGIAIWPKDLGIVVAEARRRRVGVPLAGHAHQQFVAGVGMGWGGDDDASIVRLWKTTSGIDVTCPP